MNSGHRHPTINTFYYYLFVFEVNIGLEIMNINEQHQQCVVERMHCSSTADMVLFDRLPTFQYGTDERLSQSVLHSHIVIMKCHIGSS